MVIYVIIDMRNTQCNSIWGKMQFLSIKAHSIKWKSHTCYCYELFLQLLGFSRSWQLDGFWCQHVTNGGYRAVDRSADCSLTTIYGVSNHLQQIAEATEYSSVFQSCSRAKYLWTVLCRKKEIATKRHLKRLCYLWVKGCNVVVLTMLVISNKLSFHGTALNLMWYFTPICKFYL